MALSDRDKDKLGRLEKRLARSLDGDPRAWWAPLAKATVALLAEGKTVTVETLIERLEQMPDGPEVFVKRPVSQAAIEHLRKAVMHKD